MRRALTVLAVFLVAACGTTAPTAVTTSPPSSPTSASPRAGPSPSPTPPPDYGPPPAGLDLLYFQVPGSPTWLIGYDWTGAPRATVHLKELDGHVDEIGSGINVAPNGSGFVSSPYTYDRLGNLIYQGPPPDKGSVNGTWSEDGQVLCGVETQGSAVDSNGNGTVDYYLVRRAPNGPAVRVAHFLHLDYVPGDMGLTMYACSHWLDRALIVRTVCCGIQGALVLRLSDGAVLATWNRDGGSPVFSPDGQELADPTWTTDGKTVSTEVRLILGGTVLARYGAGIEFRAFSGNNRFAVVTAGGRAQVIEVSTRRVVWSDPQGRPLSRVWARPGSGDVALAFTQSPAQVPCPSSPSSSCTNPIDEVVIVHADSTSIGLGGNLLMPMTWGY